MKKTIFALLLGSLTSSAYAADFASLAAMSAADIAVKAEVASVPAPVEPVKEATQVPQDLIYKFEQAKNDLWRLSNDTTWIRSDIDRLESTARRIAQTNSADPFFQSELQRKAWDLNRYNSDAQRLGMTIKNLLGLAQSDQGLNRVARNMDMDARTLLNRAQFDIENSTQRLEWAVRSARPELIGYNSQWVATDLSRYGRDFTWKVRDISWDCQSLVSKTQP